MLQQNTCSFRFFGLGAAAVRAAAAAHNISTEAERDAWDVYCCCCSWLLLFLSYTCDASVMVVDCAAVETGCMLEK